MPVTEHQRQHHRHDDAGVGRHAVERGLVDEQREEGDVKPIVFGFDSVTSIASLNHCHGPRLLADITLPSPSVSRAWRMSVKPIHARYAAPTYAAHQTPAGKSLPAPPRRRAPAPSTRIARHQSGVAQKPAFGPPLVSAIDEQPIVPGPGWRGRSAAITKEGRSLMPSFDGPGQPTIGFVDEPNDQPAGNLLFIRSKRRVPVRMEATRVHHDKAFPSELA